MSMQRRLLYILSLVVILTLLFSAVSLPPASAQGADGIQRQVNTQTGKLSFLGPEDGQALSAARALGTSARPQDPAMALVKRFGPEFGLQNPERDLSEMKHKQAEDGRLTVRYQQNYEGIPVMGGELIVNTNERGDLYSINGEVSSAFSLPTQPTIDPEQARQTALEAMAKWHQTTPEEFVATEPELWIYDESLLRPSTRPAELVWRMDVTSVDNSLPVRELVLVNAQRGGISLHFNQIDTAWSMNEGAIQDPDPTPTSLPTETLEPVVTATPAPEEPKSTEEVSVSDVSRAEAAAVTGATWYVATTGSNSNSCSVPASPCLTIDGAIGKAAAGDTIKVAMGTYIGTGYRVVSVNKSIYLSGGWNANFSTQNEQSVIDGQKARGGIFIWFNNVVTIDHFLITNSGTGIDNDGGTVTLLNSSLLNNLYGVENHGALSATNITLAQNSSYGIVNFHTLTVQSSTIVDNGVGIYSGSYVLATTTVQNSILARNNKTCKIEAGSITSTGNNIIGATTGCTFPLQASDKVGVNPQLGLLMPNGYFPLLSTSPAIDSAASCATAADQRGLARPQGSACDIGAYEYAAPGSVTSLGIVSGNNQHVAPSIALFQPLKVAALDSQGSPVPNVSITFVAPDSGASGVFADTGMRTSTAITNLNGIATSSTFTANANLGAYTVTASASGAGSVNFSLQNSSWYVATAGNDSNSCLLPTSPCATIQGAIAKAAAGDIILITTGVYTSSSFTVVQIDKGINLSGGWNATFTARDGFSTIDGQHTRQGVYMDTVMDVTLDRFIVKNGTYSEGGGIRNPGASVNLTISNSSIQNNSATSYHGGGIYNNGNLILTNTTVSNNSAAYGGGIDNYPFGNLTLNNSTVSNNSATDGGGIYNEGNLTLNNTTISDNSASSQGGGIFNESTGGGVILQNSILARNTAMHSRPDCFGNVDSAGYNLIGNSSGCLFTAATGDLVGTNSNPIDPRFLIIPDPRAATFSYLLLPDSPALNTGNPVTPGSGGNACLATDRRGVARPVGSRCDIGSFEYQGSGTLPAHIFVYAGTPQHLDLGSPAPSVLQALVLDEDGDTVPGKTVTFAAPGSGSSAIFANTGTNSSTCITGANGIATSSGFSATNIRGSYIITATVVGVTDPANFQMVNGLSKVKTYTGGPGIPLPGTFLCDQTKPNCTNGSNSHADAAHRYAIGTRDFYHAGFERYGFDNAGMTVISTVHYCDPDDGCPYANAFWNGEQMVFGDEFDYPLADDVVAHEFTHGVTEYESNLFYYYQSGAINESFSDLWGEYYDQSNSEGNDGSNVKWRIGEDILGQGVTRSMSDPSFYGHPDMISSPNYYEGEDDNGGVHTNSGVNNKAVYLMVDGGAFNGKTVTALGWEKTAAIYYEVNTNLLLSGSDYSDLYYALQQACTNLIGKKGITAGDCTEVKDALDAVQMNSQPAPNFNTDAPLCTVNTPVIAFADDLETGTGKWTFSNGAYKRWQLDTPYGPYAQSGQHSLFADDYPAKVTDATAKLTAFVVPSEAYLHFAHAYGFESGYNTGDPTFYNFDGGVLEYSTNGGSTWTDAGSLIQANGYKGTLFTGAGNPLSGRSAFVGSSHGYISTRLNLASLAGKTVTFRWRMGLDEAGFAWGWWVDNVKVYTCGEPSIFNDVPKSHWAWQYVERLYNAKITGGCGTNPLQYCPESTVTRAQMAIFLLKGIHGSSYAPPAVGGDTGFSDVQPTHWAGKWIKQLAAERITGGCATGKYCPDSAVTRAQMAIFLLKAKHGASYSPPAVGATTGFGDVPTEHWAAKWIKQLAAEGITGGCGNGNYCPDTPVTRAQMAVFLVKTFNLP